MPLYIINIFLLQIHFSLLFVILHHLSFPQLLCPPQGYPRRSTTSLPPLLHFTFLLSLILQAQSSHYLPTDQVAPLYFMTVPSPLFPFLCSCSFHKLHTIMILWIHLPFCHPSSIHAPLCYTAQPRRLAHSNKLFKNYLKHILYMQKTGLRGRSHGCRFQL